jgi:oxepin-CoA hydrolase / 3-oxo-5,6-dehydrosuberyl-CoA semialdehyde dehydrogenase
MAATPFDVNDAKLRDAFFREWLFDALAGLQDDSRPGWGKMSARQMVEHLVWAFELSTGHAQAACQFPEAQREQLKAFLYHDRPTPREFQNPAQAAGLPPLRHAGLPEAKMALLVEVECFLRQASDTPDAMHMHPVFGPIGAEEWARSHFKHAYHHLLQFGLIEGTPDVA